MTGISLKKTTTSLGHYDNVPAQTPTPDPEPENGDKDYARFNFICDKRFVKKLADMASMWSYVMAMALRLSMVTCQSTLWLKTR